jgi:hypothetical protein
MADRDKVQDHYKGHEVDIDTAVDRFSIMEEGANPNPPPLDDDTEVELGPKEPENPNDPYCTC